MYEQKGLEIVNKCNFRVKNLDFVKIILKNHFCFTRFGLRGSKFGSLGMILSAIEAELHKDSIFNVKTYYFRGVLPDFDRTTKILGGAIVENSKISPNKRLGPICPNYKKRKQQISESTGKYSPGPRPALGQAGL